MDNKPLESLVKIGQLKKEAFSESEDNTYLRSGTERLRDAATPGMSLSGKFLKRCRSMPGGFGSLTCQNASHTLQLDKTPHIALHRMHYALRPNR
jgi:hypothetical protein